MTDAAATSDESALLASLRAGDEGAFLSLVERHQASMTRIAMLHCGAREAAEEVVQETWLAVFEGVGRFEGRSTLKTWLFSIVVNKAKTRGARDKRCVPLSTLGGAGADGGGDDGPCVDPDRFRGEDDRWPGHWKTAPKSWGDRPDAPALAHELRRRIEAAIHELPDAQRRVITLCDIDGLDPAEVCNALGITETNRRVILHRARSRVRGALEAYFDGDDRP